MSNLGPYIRNKRLALHDKYAGYSIRNLAKRIGIHHSFLSKLERGEADTLSEEKIILIARELGEDPDILMALGGKLSEKSIQIIKEDPASFINTLRNTQHQSTNEPAKPDFYTQRLEERKAELEEITMRLRQEMKERKEAVKALQLSEARHRAMFEANAAMQLIIDPDTGSILDANPAACAFYGYERAVMQSMNISDLNTLSGQEVSFALNQARIHHQTVFSFPQKKSSGRTCEVELRSALVPHNDKMVLHSIIIDVSERKQLQESLKRDSIIKDALARASQRLLGEAFSLEDISRIILDKSRELTQSNQGLVGSIEQTTGYAWGYAHTLDSSPGKAGKGMMKKISFIPDSRGRYPGLWFTSINSGKTYLTNNAPEDHDKHEDLILDPPRNSLLSIPVMDKDSPRVIGLIAVADSIRQYTPPDIGVINDLAVLYSLCLHRLGEENAAKESKN